MSTKKGNISVQTADIFPIIKKWLYSEHDIFARELVSNATDAITKRATLGRSQNVEIPAGRIDITVNKSNKTIKITDNGLGMSEADVEKYIAQLAFSGAEEFVTKMKDSEQSGADIIGKFGLGFYSAFMIADKVMIDSLSMEPGAKATRWICEGDTEYTFETSDKEDIGTTITLHVNKESEEFLNEWKTSEVLTRYCDFMPYPIGILDEEKEPTKPLKEDGSVDEDATPIAVTPKIINTTTPLWKKDPTTLKDEDYQQFYKQLFPMDSEPLFWLHLKVDHPFELEGVLYFPKINPKMPFQEKNIKLYQKQVFVSDNVKNIVPEFLSLLKGVIDSTDIPLNVSRSSLQGDPNVKKISNYIIRKVAESLKKLFKNDRPKFEAIWEDSGLFVKYGAVSDDKFDELMREMVIFKNSEDKYQTLSEYQESLPKDAKEKLGDKILYFEKENSDHSLRSQLLESSIHCLETDDHIDPHFMQHVEMKKRGDKTYAFTSVDTEFSNLLETENQTAEDTEVKELFEKVLAPVSQDKKETKDDKEAKPAGPKAVTVEIQKITGGKIPAYYKTDEQMKKFAKMAQGMGQNSMFPTQKTLVINPNNPLIQNALKISKSGNKDQLVKKICHHVEDLAQISSEGLNNNDKEHFIKRTQELISELTQFAL